MDGDNQGIFILQPREQMIQGIPTGKLNNLNNRVAKLEQGGSVTLKTNGTTNGSQSILNLQQGSNITISDNGTGTITITGTGAGGSGITRSVNSISTNTAAGSSASVDYVYKCTATLTLTLPTAVGNSNLYTIKNTAGTTTIATTSSQTIDGSLTATISVANTSLSVVSDGANWLIV